MDYVYYIYNNVKYFYNSMNPATLSGAIDVIVVEQPDGSLLSTPFHVRFGKYGVFNYDNKYVDIEINGEEIDLKMKLGENGVAFFVEKAGENDEPLPSHLATSPIPMEKDLLGRLMASVDPSVSAPMSALTEPVGVGKQSPLPTSTIQPLQRSPRKRTSQQHIFNSKAAPRKKDSVSSADGEDSRSPSPVPSDRRTQATPPRSSITISSSSPGPTQPKLTVQQPLAGNNQQQKTNAQRHRLPFSFSIYSCRQNRSLPDLSTLLASKMQSGEEHDLPRHGDVEEKPKKKKKGHHRKSTFGTVEMKKLKMGGVGPAHWDRPTKGATAENRGLFHSSSASMPLKSYNDPKEDKANALLNEQVVSPHPDDTGGDCENACLDSPGIEMKRMPGDLADGALSDSEVDRHRNTPRENDTEWKWGEIPKSAKKQKDAKMEDSAKQSRWNYWFRWSSGKSESRSEQTVTKGAEKKKDEGLYLQDLGNDPDKMKKYFGQGSSGPMSHSFSISSNASSNMDSGNAVSLGASPGAASVNESEVAPLTGEQQRVYGDIAAQNWHYGQHDTETLASEKEASEVKRKERYDSGTSGASTIDFDLSDEEPGNAALKPKSKYKRSLRLSSEQLQLLGLDYGTNDARFSITTKFQGTAWCSCHIYLLKWTDKLVISDVDGTITKSDVLGHVIPAIGGTWAHSGVTELYTRIKMNGYQMVYLSSRAIGQSHYTKTYLMSVAQGSQTLPDGPVLLSPTSVLMAFKKEVIERRPEEFKIACLNDLKSLFPIGQPFFAGFGNRETDVKSYQAVGIPLEKIMIIDPRGRLRRADNRNGLVSDYATMAMSSVDYVFPPRFLEEPVEQLSEFAAWRCNPDQFDHLVDAELDSYKQRRRQSVGEGVKGNAKKRVDSAWRWP